MSTVPCANYRRTFTTERTVNDKVEKTNYELNMTARKLDSMSSEVMSILIVKTVKLWLYIAKAIELGQRELPEAIAYKSAEMSMEDETETELQQFSETRFTIFDWNHKLELTLHSNSLPQPTLELWWAMEDAQKELETLYPSKPIQMNVDAHQSDATPPQGNNTPATTRASNPAPAVEGAIVATRAPNSNRPDYADGQLVSFTVTKIVASSNKGSAVYQMWTPLGTQYPTLSIYKLKPDGNLKPDYENIVPVLNTLNLSLDKPEAAGTWRLVCKAAHADKDGVEKEYLNVVSLAAI